jgi:hypothetical protein
MIGVVEISPLMARQMGRPLMIGVPLFVFALDFVFLLVWLLVVVTAAGPLLVPRSVSGPVQLLRWWWRRRHT